MLGKISELRTAEKADMLDGIAITSCNEKRAPFCEKRIKFSKKSKKLGSNRRPVIRYSMPDKNMHTRRSPHRLLIT